MSNGDIHVKYREDGTPMFRMEGYPSFSLEDVIPGRETGLLDMDGKPLFDGDMVLNLNRPGEWAAEPCEVRRLRYEQDRFPPLWTAGGASIETLSQYPRFGVRKQ